MPPRRPESFFDPNTHHKPPHSPALVGDAIPLKGQLHNSVVVSTTTTRTKKPTRFAWEALSLCSHLQAEPTPPQQPKISKGESDQDSSEDSDEKSADKQGVLHDSKAKLHRAISNFVLSRATNEMEIPLEAIHPIAKETVQGVDQMLTKLLQHVKRASSCHDTLQAARGAPSLHLPRDCNPQLWKIINQHNLRTPGYLPPPNIAFTDEPWFRSSVLLDAEKTDQQTPRETGGNHTETTGGETDAGSNAEKLPTRARTRRTTEESGPPFRCRCGAEFVHRHILEYHKFYNHVKHPARGSKPSFEYPLAVNHSGRKRRASRQHRSQRSGKASSESSSSRDDSDSTSQSSSVGIKVKTELV